ncbi:hypothetical protein [Azospirillum sp. B4]|uniref:hypothetical protein n=1 Tax=Azospirillum sp. B4 TaxID=95605 RepID=UPI0011DE47D6|nr:hypothetical protein [Azospirillum sp. B4]
MPSFEKAKQKWNYFFKNYQDKPISSWAKWLTDEQISFEHACGGRWPGQEVMAWSGFGALYTTQSGLDENLPLAKKLAGAFFQSSCSLEVKAAARKAAAFYLGSQDDG